MSDARNTQAEHRAVVMPGWRLVHLSWNEGQCGEGARLLSMNIMRIGSWQCWQGVVCALIEPRHRAREAHGNAGLNGALAAVIRGNRGADVRIQLCHRMTDEVLISVQSVVCAVFNETSATNTLVQFGHGDRGAIDSHRRLVVGFALMELEKSGVEVVVDFGLRATNSRT